MARNDTSEASAVPAWVGLFLTSAARFGGSLNQSVTRSNSYNTSKCDFSWEMSCPQLATCRWEKTFAKAVARVCGEKFT